MATYILAFPCNRMTISREETHCEVSSLGRRKASSAGPLLTRMAWGTWRLIRASSVASPSDRSDRERVETTRDIEATLLLVSSDLTDILQQQLQI